jgi:hypothetical protein
MQVRVVETDRSPALVRRADEAHAAICLSQRELFAVIAEIDRSELWKRDGAHDMAHWLWMRYGLSDWKARRWLAAAHALESLPRIDEAFASGSLGVDKVVELCRFATPENEDRLVVWAQRVSAGAIRSRGDREIRRSLQETQDIERSRYLRWWHEDDGRTLCLEARYPAAAGAVVARALERVADQLPSTPEGEEHRGPDARRADALAAVCSARIASDADQDRATIVAHVPLEVLTARRGDNGVASDRVAGDEPGCGLEGSGVIHAETARRLACTARIETVVEDRGGTVVGLGRTSREPSAQMLRALRHRDVGCRFPGCGSRRFTHAHHIRWWSVGGPTDMDNLVLLCGFHHRLVHEFGWSLARRAGREVSWFRPDGRRYRAGPAPPRSDVSGSRPEGLRAAHDRAPAGV